MFYVYVLQSEADNNLYIGYTTNPKTRIKQHNDGQVESTKGRRPLKLIFYEAYVSEKDARNRELFLKSGRGHEVLYKQLAETLGK